MARSSKTPELPAVIPARWVGFYGRTYEGAELVPHVTVLDVPRDEAIESDHWQPLGTAPTDSTDTEGDA